MQERLRHHPKEAIAGHLEDRQREPRIEPRQHPSNPSVAQIKNLQVLERAHGFVPEETALQLVVAEIHVPGGVAYAGQAVELQIDGPGEEVVAEINVLGVAELGEQIAGIAPEGVAAEVDAAQVLELPDPVGGEAPGEVVVGEVEVDEAREVGEVAGDGAVEAVAGEVEVAERGEEADGGGQAAGEGVAGKGEVLQRAHAGERVELELPGEAEPVEGEADDGAAVADHAAPPGGARIAAAAGIGRLRRRPGSLCMFYLYSFIYLFQSVHLLHSDFHLHSMTNVGCSYLSYCIHVVHITIFYVTL